MRLITSWVIRLFMRPFMSRQVPVWLQRFWSDLVGFLLIGPRNAKRQSIQMAGLYAMQIDPETCRPEHSVLYLHGGGYVSCSSASHSKLAAWVGHATGSRVFVPEYRMAPEYVYPIAVNDSVEVYRALLEGGQDPAKLIIAGDSAGGGLSLATAIAIRDLGLPLPAGLVLYSPWVDLSLSGESVISNASKDAMLKPDWVRWCANRYRGALPADHPACSPLFADLKGLPPALIHAGSDDILLSDSTRLAERLENAGVPHEFTLFEGVGHVFQFLTEILPDADRSIRMTSTFVDTLSRTLGIRANSLNQQPQREIALET